MIRTPSSPLLSVLANSVAGGGERAAAIASSGLLLVGSVALWSNRSDAPTVVSSDTDTDGATPSDQSEPGHDSSGHDDSRHDDSRHDCAGIGRRDPVPSSVWGAIAGDPRGAALYPSVVWTGSEALVVGGLDRTGASVGGAAGYDPATDTWRRLADPPNGARRINALTVWTGAEMLVIGGDNPDGSLLVSYGEAYDPEMDTWRYTASPPIGFVSDRSPAVWTGDELLCGPGTAVARRCPSRRSRTTRPPTPGGSFRSHRSSDASKRHRCGRARSGSCGAARPASASSPTARRTTRTPTPGGSSPSPPVAAAGAVGVDRLGDDRPGRLPAAIASPGTASSRTPTVRPTTR